MNAEAWLVIAASGFRAVFIDETQALNYAVRCHGVVIPLVRQEPNHEHSGTP